MRRRGPQRQPFKDSLPDPAHAAYPAGKARQGSSRPPGVHTTGSLSWERRDGRCGGGVKESFRSIRDDLG